MTVNREQKSNKADIVSAGEYRKGYLRKRRWKNRTVCDADVKK